MNQSESAISNDAWGSRASSEGHEGGKLAPRAQGLLRCLGGDIPRGGAGIALAFRLCVFGLHHSRGRGGCPSVLAVASLKETRGLLSRFECVYSDYITQGCPGGALAVAMSLRARCFFFPTHIHWQLAGHKKRRRKLVASQIIMYHEVSYNTQPSTTGEAPKRCPTFPHKHAMLSSPSPPPGHRSVLGAADGAKKIKQTRVRFPP